MLLLLSWFSGCCCPCFPTRADPVPVPPEHLAMLGTWACESGTAWSFRPDGTYSHREELGIHPDGVITGYAGQAWTLDTARLFGVVVDETRIEVAPDPGQPACVTIAHRTCARVAAPPPPELVGRWEGDGSVLEVRRDGFGRWHGPGAPAVEGALSFGDEVRITLCAKDVVLPVAVAGGVLTLGGAAMTLSDPHYDEHRLEAEAERLRQVRASRPRSFDSD